MCSRQVPGEGRARQPEISRPRSPGEVRSTMESVPLTSPGTAVPLIVVEPAEENNDEPPPYSSTVPPDHVGWPFSFSPGIPYSGCASCARSGTRLPGLQANQGVGSGSCPEGTDGQHTSIMMPLMPCQFFKFGSHRSIFAQRPIGFTEGPTVTKTSGGKNRRYGVILVAAAVMAFLMALSLLVRFIVEGKFWRG